jgi:SAM-dependent methyltransferase
VKGSIPLYDALAPDYDAHFAVAHRRAYDELAWEGFEARLPPPSATPVIDVGCGSGRGARRLRALGHPVVGVEQAPAMAAAARARGLDDVTVIEASMEAVDLPPASAAGVVAMGSVQYADDPAAAIARLASWAAPGAPVAVLVDSRVALAAELIRDGRTEEAVTRLATGRGVWRTGGHEAELHLLDRADLVAAMTAAGLVDIEVRGLLVGSSVWGRDGCRARLEADWETSLEEERRLSRLAELADLGKQLFAVGMAPAVR